MAIRKPVVWSGTEFEQLQSSDTLSIEVIARRYTFNNANYTIPSDASVVAQVGTLSNFRTVTLPSASSRVGSTITIIDESRTSWLYNIRVVPASGSIYSGGALVPFVEFGLSAQSLELRAIDNNGSPTWEVISSSSIRTRNCFSYYTDFTEGLDLTTSVNGSGASVGGFSVGDRNEVLLLNTGSTAAGVSAIGRGRGASGAVTTNFHALRSGSEIIHSTVFALDNASTSTQRYIFFLGLARGWGTNDSTGGLYLRYTDSDNSGKFQLYAREASSTTATDTGITPVANTFYEFLVRIADTATASAYLREHSLSAQNAWTALTIPPSNFPTGRIGPGSSIAKTVGTADRGLYLDRWATYQHWT